MDIEHATEADTEEILSIYQSLVGTKYCAWTEEYPGRGEIEFDLSRNALYCYRVDGRIAAVISIDKDEAVEGLGCWTPSLQPSLELSRLGVLAEFQNRGIAKEMILSMMGEAKSQGMKSIHFLVAKDNKKAIRAYGKLDCAVVGECRLFEHDWWCYEKAL